MSLPTMEQLQQMSDEEVAAMNRRMKKVAIRNVLIFVGVKVTIAYAMHRWAKSLEKN